ncbi:MAG TPA: DUF4126 family protein [Chthoniobacterales bacterium]|nr:DUF4126 family protein [Chthoniobacterales bacterium]
MNTTIVVIAVFGIGFLCGLRSFAPLTLVSWMAVWGWTPVAGSPFWFIGKTGFAVAITILAVVELIADKLPQIPARTQLMPLVARFVTGGIAAAAMSFSAGRPWLYGLLLGPVGAMTGAFAGYYARRSLVQSVRIPDLVVALVEDLITIAGTLFLVHNFFHTPV